MSSTTTNTRNIISEEKATSNLFTLFEPIVYVMHGKTHTYEWCQYPRQLTEEELTLYVNFFLHNKAQNGFLATKAFPGRGLCDPLSFLIFQQQKASIGLIKQFVESFPESLLANNKNILNHVCYYATSYKRVDGLIPFLIDKLPDTATTATNQSLPLEAMFSRLGRNWCPGVSSDIMALVQANPSAFRARSANRKCVLSAIFRHPQITTEALDFVCHHAVPPLMQLTISNCDITLDRARAFSKLLPKLNGTLTLEIEAGKSHEGLSTLLDCLMSSQCCAITSLNVEMVSQYRESIERMVVARSSMLRSLTIRSADATSVVANLLNDPGTQLQALEITYDGAVKDMTKLCEALARNSTLDSLVVRTLEPICKDDIEVLEKALMTNTCLESLRLIPKRKPLGPASTRGNNIWYWIALNRIGRRELENCATEAKLVVMLEQAQKGGPRLLYGILRQAPGVWCRAADS